MLACISIFAFGVLSVSAYTGTRYGDTPLYYEVSNSEVTITDCSNSAKPIEIPATIDGKPVTSIGAHAFSDCTKLTSITIPDSVTSIGDYAFVCCESLTSITIPNNITSISEYTFFGCKYLNEITLPQSITKIEENAFYGCLNLSAVYYNEKNGCGMLFP